MFIFILLAVFFIAYLPPLTTLSDGAEFALSLATLGISHPPSYPLFINLGKLFYFLPAGSIYLRLCLFSSIVTSLIFLTIWKLYKGDVFEKTALSIFILSSDNLFENTLIGEVYGLNLLFFALIYFLLYGKRDIRRFFLVAFILGLGAGNHQTIILFIPFIAYEIYKQRAETDLNKLFFITFLFIFGLSVYLYLPFRAIKDNIWNWGNPYNLKFFLTSLLRLDFQNKGFLRTPEHFLNQMLSLNPLNEVGLIGSMAVTASLVIIFIKDRNYFIKHILLYLMFSVFIVILLGYDDIASERMPIVYGPFFLPAYFVLGLLVAKSISYLKGYVRYGAIAILFIGLIIQQSYYLKGELKKYSIKSYSYAKSQLSMLPKGAVLIVEGGERDFPLFYERLVKKFRTDLIIIPLSMLGKKWNFKESIELGAAYQKGYEGEQDEKKAILKAVTLFHKDFKGKRVFTNIIDEAELPVSLPYKINGIFYEFGEGAPIDLDFFRSYGLSREKDQMIIELLEKQLTIWQSRNETERVLKIKKILEKISNQ